MPLTGDFPVEAPPQKEWTPIPEGIYQAVIKDIDEREGKKYHSEESIVQYLFKFVILDGPAEAQGQTITSFASRRWFIGSKNLSPSKVVDIFRAVYSHYYPGTEVANMEAADVTTEVMNDLIGKQLQLVVKINPEKTGNKVTDFLATKTELEIPEGIVIAKVVGIKPRSKEELKATLHEEVSPPEDEVGKDDPRTKNPENVNPSDIPF